MLGHGADHFSAGGYAIITGRHRFTMTEMLLQKAGMSSEWASFSNNLLSMGGFTGSIGFVRNFVYQNNHTISQAAMNSFKVSVSSFKGLQTGKNFKPFTKDFYRENLTKLTDISPSGKTMHAHHVFTQKFETEFIKSGINIHNPNYTQKSSKIGRFKFFYHRDHRAHREK